MSDVRVWVNGDLVDPGAPSISALDHGITVGDGAFETCKVVDGEVFALTRHLRRMDRSLAGLGLPTADHGLIRKGVDAVLSLGPLPFGRLRFTVTGGPGPPGSDRADSALTTLVTAGPQPRPPVSTTVVVVPWTRNERAATAGLKTTSYADNVVALAYAKQRGAHEAVFANTRGNLCEGTGSNVFVVAGGRVLTPPLADGPLAGITRELVLEWAAADGLPVQEATMPVSVLGTCDEAFLTSSTRDVAAIGVVDGRELAAPGPLTARVASVFAARAAERMDP
ncbi:MAG TPA: aminotransferase class IV [Dermatophilaceae bacterium]|nr:aminotransferase class IV [Dermatophilaceae bacterium]